MPQSSSLLEILLALNTSAIPMNISKTVRNNAGGAWNHLCYFKVRSLLATGMALSSAQHQAHGEVCARHGRWAGIFLHAAEEAVSML